jgi:hypothetical protein
VELQSKNAAMMFSVFGFNPAFVFNGGRKDIGENDLSLASQ